MTRRASGDWQPHATHPTLLAVQLVALWQAGLRGLDYVGGLTGRGLDAAAADPALGWLLYGSTILVLVGLAIRRGVPVVLGHALLASWYVGLGYDALNSDGVLVDGWAWVGLLLGGAGTVVLVSNRYRSAARLLIGVLGMLAGQALLVDDLGSDYRTGTGLVAGGLLHAILAVGTFVLWQRERLGRQVDAELA